MSKIDTTLLNRRIRKELIRLGLPLLGMFQARKASAKLMWLLIERNTRKAKYGK